MGFWFKRKQPSLGAAKSPLLGPVLILLLLVTSSLTWSKTKETKSQSKFLKSMTWFSEGRDSSGRGFVDRLEVYPNGKVEWQTTSRNSLCDGEVQGAGEGGLYEGEIKKIELRKLQSLLENLGKYKSQFAQKHAQKNSPDLPGRESQATTYLMWESELGVETFNFQLQPESFWNGESTKILDQIQWELARIKMRLSPKTVAKMESRWGQSSLITNSTIPSKSEKSKGENFKEIEVHFSLLGPSNFSVILPKEASEAFMVDGGGEISYGKSNKAIFQKKKNADDPFDHWVVQIRLPWGQDIERQIQKEKGIRLYYSANNLSQLRKGPWHDLNLCAFLPLEAKNSVVPSSKGSKP